MLLPARPGLTYPASAGRFAWPRTPHLVHAFNKSPRTTCTTCADDQADCCVRCGIPVVGRIWSLNSQARRHNGLVCPVLMAARPIIRHNVTRICFKLRVGRCKVGLATLSCVLSIYVRMVCVLCVVCCVYMCVCCMYVCVVCMCVLFVYVCMMCQCVCVWCVCV